MGSGLQRGQWPPKKEVACREMRSSKREGSSKMKVAFMWPSDGGGLQRKKWPSKRKAVFKERGKWISKMTAVFRGKCSSKRKAVFNFKREVVIKRRRS